MELLTLLLFLDLDIFEECRSVTLLNVPHFEFDVSSWLPLKGYILVGILCPFQMHLRGRTWNVSLIPISVVLSLISLLMWYASVSPLSNYYVSFIISNLLGNILKLLYEFLLHNFSILWWFSNSIIPCVSWHYNLRKRFIFYLIYLFTPLYWYRLMDSHFIQYVIIHYYHYSFWCSNCLRLDQRESF